MGSWANFAQLLFTGAGLRNGNVVRLTWLPACHLISDTCEDTENMTLEQYK